MQKDFVLIKANKPISPAFIILDNNTIILFLVFSNLTP